MSVPAVADSVEPAPQTVGSGPPQETTRRNVGADLWRAVAHNKKAVIGALLLAFFLVLAIFPGEIAPYSPTA